MSTPSHPPIPPRPQRTTSGSSASPETPSSSSTTTTAAAPLIPPRPSVRRNPASADKSDNVPTLQSNVSPSVELAMPVPVSSSGPTITTDAPTPQSSEKQTPARSTSALSNHSEKGIPVIGRRVPMYPNAGDVQAPTPAPESKPTKHNPVYKPLNFGEYSSPGLNERVSRNAFAMSSDDLSQSVHSTATSGHGGVGTKSGSQPVPDEDLAYVAAERMMSPDLSKQQTSQFEFTPRDEKRLSSNAGGFLRLTEEDVVLDELHAKGTPILASDEVMKSGMNTPAYYHGTPQVKPTALRSRRGSDMSEVEDLSAIQKTKSIDLDPSEHEPLFPESEDAESEKPAVPIRPSLKRVNSKGDASTHRFPSNDLWEDAPSSANLEATVVGGIEGKEARPLEQDEESLRLPVVPRSGTATPMHVNSLTGISTPPDHDSNYVPPKPTIRSSSRGSTRSKKFPSKDLWEDAPDSYHLSATVTPRPDGETQQSDDEGDTKIPTPHIPSAAPVDKTPTPARSSSPEKKTKPPVAKKPPIPPRPAKKPGLINSNFLADLNSRLARGPRVEPPAKEESPKEEEKPAEPLPDVRKSRARGPARRRPGEKKEEQKLSIAGGTNQIMGVWVIWEVNEEEEVEVSKPAVSEVTVDDAEASKPFEEQEAEVKEVEEKIESVEEKEAEKKVELPSAPPEEEVAGKVEDEAAGTDADIVVVEKPGISSPEAPREEKKLAETENLSAKEVLEAADRG